MESGCHRFMSVFHNAFVPKREIPAIWLEIHQRTIAHGNGSQLAMLAGKPNFGTELSILSVFPGQCVVIVAVEEEVKFTSFKTRFWYWTKAPKKRLVNTVRVLGVSTTGGWVRSK